MAVHRQAGTLKLSERRKGDSTLRAPAAFAGDLSLVPNTTSGNSQRPVIPAPGGLMPSSGLHRLMHACGAQTCTHVSLYT